MDLGISTRFSPDAAPIRSTLERYKIPVFGVLALVVVASCVVADLTGSSVYLRAPVAGVATIGYAVVVRSLGGGLLGVLELFAPVGLVVVVSLMVAPGAA